MTAVSAHESVRGITKQAKILYLHSNTGALAKRLHASRVQVYNGLGYDVRLFDSTQWFAPTIFPYVDKAWKKRDAALLAFYERLAPELDRADVFIHYNGGNIHPRFLDQFDCLKIYHCADDPDGSAVMSRPVAREYDVCAISNVACIDMYKGWGCRSVFFWPLGSSFPDDVIDGEAQQDIPRDVPVVFVGSKLGVESFRYFGRLFGMYKRRRFMEAIEREVSGLHAFGAGWNRGFIADEDLPRLYRRSRIGLNKHNSLGPINFRLYDLAAFEVLQVCDNRDHLGTVYRLDDEVVGYRTLRECVALIDHYRNHPDEALEIAAAGRRRFKRDYAAVPLWENFVRNVNDCLASSA